MDGDKSDKKSPKRGPCGVADYGSATVRGTVRLTEDRCDGTRVRVVRGLVAVRDLARHKTVMVHVGHSYLALARR